MQETKIMENLSDKIFEVDTLSKQDWDAWRDFCIFWISEEKEFYFSPRRLPSNKQLVANTILAYLATAPDIETIRHGVRNLKILSFAQNFLPFKQKRAIADINNWLKIGAQFELPEPTLELIAETIYWHSPSDYFKMTKKSQPFI